MGDFRVASGTRLRRMGRISHCPARWPAGNGPHGLSDRPGRETLPLTTHPGTPRFGGIPGPVVIGVLLLEVSEYVLGAVSGPGYQ